MKKFTSLMFALFACVCMANAQRMIDWDENGQFTFYPEDLVCEGGISYDEDKACFVADGTQGRLYLNLDGQTIDFSEVAHIDVNGSEYKDNPWGGDDPLMTLFISDAVNGKINEWYGSRYNVDFKAWAANASKVDQFYFTTRPIVEEEKDEEGNVIKADTIGYVAGDIYLDEIILTKTVEQDPMAITGSFWHEWDGYEAGANIVASDLAYCGVRLNEALGGGAPFAGVLNGTVPGHVYADLTEYAGFYVKGTPETPFRCLFNRQSMEDAGDYVNAVWNINEEGELYVIFAEDAVTKELPYIHLNTVKINWGAPEGCKITKFNFIEKGEAGISSIVEKNENVNAPIYNLAGQRVNANATGILVKNGKKFIVK